VTQINGAHRRPDYVAERTYEGTRSSRCRVLRTDDRLAGCRRPYPTGQVSSHPTDRAGPVFLLSVCRPIMMMMHGIRPPSDELSIVLTQCRVTISWSRDSTLGRSAGRRKRRSPSLSPTERRRDGETCSERTNKSIFLDVASQTCSVSCRSAWISGLYAAIFPVGSWPELLRWRLLFDLDSMAVKQCPGQPLRYGIINIFTRLHPLFTSTLSVARIHCDYDESVKKRRFVCLRD